MLFMLIFNFAPRTPAGPPLPRATLDDAPRFPIKPCGITIPCQVSTAGTLRADNWMNTNGRIIGVKARCLS